MVVSHWLKLQHYLGDYGIIILSLIIIVACLKTAIGLITAFSETFTELFPKMNYLWLATGVAILACIFANVGLTKIIMYSTPVLMFIYPLAITLILLTLVSPLFNHSTIVYKFTTFFTMFARSLMVNASPEFLAKTSFAQALISFANVIYRSSQLNGLDCSGNHRFVVDLSFI